MDNFTYDEVSVNELFTDKKNEEISRMIVKMQMEFVKEFSIPASRKLKEMHAGLSKIGSVEIANSFTQSIATAIGLNITLNVPNFDEKMFNLSCKDMLQQIKNIDKQTEEEKKNDL